MAEKKRGRGNPVAAFFGFGLDKPAGKGAAPRQKKPRQVASAPASVAEDSSAVPVAAHSFSGHFITLAIVVAIIAVSIYGPLTSFIRQQNEINDARANIAALEAEQQELEAQVSWWEDDNYVKQQARSRLFYVEPGQTPYLVVGLDAASGLADDTSATAKTAPEDSWTTKLWGSLQLAAETPEASPSPSAESSDPASADPAASASVTATTPSAPGQ